MLPGHFTLNNQLNYDSINFNKIRITMHLHKHYRLVSKSLARDSKCGCLLQMTSPLKGCKT